MPHGETTRREVPGLRTLVEVAVRRPGRVLLAAGLLAAVAVWLGAGVEMRTARSELVPEDDRSHRIAEELKREFDGEQPLIAVLEPAADQAGLAALKEAADELAERLGREPAVAGVFHRVDTGWLLDHLPYLAPPDDLRRAAATIDALAGGRVRIRGIGDLNALVARTLAARMADPAAAAAAGAARAEDLSWLEMVLDAERRFLDDPTSAVEGLRESRLAGALAGRRPGTVAGGYLGSADPPMVLAIVTPSDPDDALPSLRRFVGAVRYHAGLVEQAHPEVHVALTGNPALVVEEMEAVRRDTLRTTGVALAGVTLLALLAFRWRSHALLAVAALGIGVVWSWGAVRLELGYLNMVTSSFLSTLIGVGIAYAIHPVAEFELQIGAGLPPASAVRRAFRTTGRAVVVSAVTTAGAFFAILLMDFRGFAEMGLVAGVGVLLCLAAVLATLPALLVLWARVRPPRPDARGVAAVDRLWVEAAAARVCRYPRAVVATAAVLTALAGWSAFGLRFDLDVAGMLPAGAESRRYLMRLFRHPELAPLFNVVVADDLADVARIRRVAASEPAIGRVESVLDLLPEDPEASAAAAAELARRIDRLALDAAAPPPPLGPGLRDLEGALEQAAEAAFVAGLGEVAGALDRAREKAAALAERVARATDAERSAWERGQRALMRQAGRLLERLRQALAAPPPGPEDLPPELRRRLVTRSGRFVVRLYPAGEIFDTSALTAFNDACRRVSEGTIGFPWMFQRMSERITSGFDLAFGVGAAVVLLTLLVDFRAARPAILAMIPLAVGVVWLLGLMRLLGIDFNLANLVALPLVLGVGIDNGVHVVHRFGVEGEAGMTTVLRHTARAVLIASLTTMIGFGSLALASHRGLASLGLVLLIGVGTSMAAAIVLLPNLLVALGLARS
ncbi:MAG: hypothetical protein D6718_01440 [Acidobacteria bacterium]|nr:MAG: hypothetical protein D6718_01440 [Acidobacteriota bacterium]